MADQRALYRDATSGQVQEAASSKTFLLVPSQGLQAALPILALGQMYFATDTGNLFFGTPGVGIGYIQIGDTRQVNETLLQILMEMRAMRLALTKLACDGGGAKPSDFDPQVLASDSEIADQAEI